ncbi:MAG: 6,7-dimethyl-8-ribityllumazine synthase [Bacteroidales bacterium]|nr:6,7-dimethyl-8-ribityllumazine synthase [Bacteroidales bacterium]
MATGLKGLSSYDNSKIPDAAGMRFGIVVSDWNQEITYAMRDGAYNTLIRHGAQKSNIIITHVPGSFELTLGAKLMADNSNCDAIICIGCIIQGATRHFDFICQSVTQGITQLNLTYGIPFVFGILTTNSQEQAKERAGGRYGNKGDEAAITAIQMVALKMKLEE